jgi:pimeloyl-ACP methyl ester carboxylesterase
MKNVLFLTILSWLSAACTSLRVPKVPMDTVRFVNAGPKAARGAIVLLPGYGDRPQTFMDRGFVDALRRHAPGYDIIAADAHFGYYRKHNVVERLEHDVIGPLRREGYRELWLAGASMGGFGGVAYAREHPDQVAGLLLFAPYMGPSSVVEEVGRVGLCAYRPPAKYIDNQEGFARANFGYLREIACGPSNVSVWLAVGDSDGLLPANKLLGSAIGGERFLVLPGGHGWKVWTPAVERIAPRALPPRDGNAHDEG